VYVLGRLDPQIENMMEHATNYFENKYFRAMAKDKCTATEIVLLVMMILVVIMSAYVLYNNNQLMNIFNFGG